MILFWSFSHVDNLIVVLFCKRDGSGSKNEIEKSEIFKDVSVLGYGFHEQLITYVVQVILRSLSY